MAFLGGLFKQKPEQYADPWQEQGYNFAFPGMQNVYNQMLPYFNNAMEQGAYSGQTYAGLDPYQQAAYDNAQGIGNQAQTGGQNIYDTASSNFANTAGYGQGFNDLQNYLSDPNAAFNMGNNLANSDMTQGMIDAANRDVGRNLEENTLTGIDRAAVGAGGTNNTRTGVERAVATRGAADRMADTGANIRGQMFNQGVNQFNTNVNQQAANLGNMMSANQFAQGGIGYGNNLMQGGNDYMGGFGDSMMNYNQGALTDAENQYYKGFDFPMQYAGNMMNLINPFMGFNTGMGLSKFGNSKADNIGQAMKIGAGMFGFGGY
tara:strand:+ start:4267 stop:5223 length:957 start_codon:yes stop_codon:yes gene_type:complete